MKMGYDMRHEEILLVRDWWMLYSIDGLGFKSWIYHCCTRSPDVEGFTVNRFLSISEMRDPIIKCWKCQQSPPDDIVTLWKLHNFDVIGSEYSIRELQVALNKYRTQDGDL